MTIAIYSEYKESGIQWLPEVPSHWTVKRVRHATTLNPSKREAQHLPRDLHVDFLPMEAVGTDGRIHREQKRPIEAVIDGFTYFREGDVAFAKITPCFENGKCVMMRDLAEGIGFGTTELTVLRPSSAQTVSEYLFYLLSSEPFRVLGESEMYGAGGQKRVPDEFVRNFRVAFPPIDEQKQIAEFLDHETAKIDALIEEQQRLIELLEEKRQAVISHAVTKGLDPDAPMKDSGVEWLGEVPAHWIHGAIKYVCSLVRDGTHTPPPRIDDGIPLLSVRNIVDNSLRFRDDDSMISVDHYRELARSFIVKEGDVLLAIVGATIGKTAVAVTMQKKYHIQRSLAVFRPKSDRVESGYLASIFRSVGFQSLLWSRVGFSAQPGIYLGTLADFRIPLPPLNEQQQILNALQRAVDTLDQAARKAKETIDLLRERRSALISAAVTGKIDVRNWQPRPNCAEDLPMAAEEPAAYETSEP